MKPISSAKLLAAEASVDRAVAAYAEQHLEYWFRRSRISLGFDWDEKRGKLSARVWVFNDRLGDVDLEKKMSLDKFLLEIFDATQDRVTNQQAIDQMRAAIDKLQLKLNRSIEYWDRRTAKEAKSEGS